MIRKPIEGYPLYFITADGVVLKQNGANTYGVVSPYENGRGYLRVWLQNGDEKRSFAIHRLVALAFVPNPRGLPVADHINGNKHDNRAENLQWLSFQENTQKYFGYNKIEVKPVARVAKNGKVVEIFISMTAAAKAHGYDYKTFCDAVKKGKPHRGNKWAFCDLNINIIS